MLCAEKCCDGDSDAGNCGRCGNRCPSGQKCKRGSCVCNNGQTLCGNVCGVSLTLPSIRDSNYWTIVASSPKREFEGG